MATVQRQILAAVVARLRAAPALVTKPAERVRISHRVAVTREQSPAIHVAATEDSLVEAKDCNTRRLRLVVRLFGRDDDGIESIDELMAQAVARLKPSRGHAIPYPAGVTLRPPTIRFDEEVADLDVAFAELVFEATYTAPDWSLEA